MLQHDQEKDRRIRALYREHKPSVRWNRDKMIVNQVEQADQLQIAKAEFERLYGRPAEGLELAHILKNVWVEECELMGRRYDYVAQAWFGPDGERIWD